VERKKYAIPCHQLIATDGQATALPRRAGVEAAPNALDKTVVPTMSELARPEQTSVWSPSNFPRISRFLIKGAAPTVRNRTPTFIGQELGISPVWHKYFRVTY
jgi:hypothetical protein